MRIAVAGGTGAVGRLVVTLAEAAGHEVRVLSRSTGVDLEHGTGLDLTGVDVVIDASGVQTTSAKRSVEFFTKVTGHLLAAEADAGVGHHVALSILGAACAARLLRGEGSSRTRGFRGAGALVDPACRPVLRVRAPGRDQGGAARDRARHAIAAVGGA